MSKLISKSCLKCRKIFVSYASKKRLFCSHKCYEKYSKGKPNKSRKIRKLVSKNKSGDVYGITIPRDIALKYYHKEFKIRERKNGFLVLFEVSQS